MLKKSISVLLVFALITPIATINFSWDDLRINDNEKLGKPDSWNRLWSGQIFIDWIYGAERVSIEVWNENLKIESLTTVLQQVNIKIKTTDIKTLATDFPDAEYEYLYNESGYSFITVETSMEDVAQRFWDRLLHKRVTLADKDYVEKITLNQRMSLVAPLDYAEDSDIVRTTYDLCDDYGILDLNYSGTGISIAVLDTGVKRTHLGFNNTTTGYNTTIFNESFVVGEDWQDLNGHGTHCIGIIAGQNTSVAGEPMRGIAPNATIYSIKVLDSKGRGIEGDIIKGIRRAVELNVDIISMSLGGHIDYFSALHDAIHYAIGKGVIVVAASGNSAEIVSCQPASWEGVISVGALKEDKHIAAYTCLGADIFAEGTNITSLSSKNVNRTSTKSGTSMACPIIAGVIALLLEAEPSLRGKPSNVLSYLKSSGCYAPATSSPVKVFYVSAVPDNYCYLTREVNPDSLCELTTVSDITRIPITDIRTQLLRNNGV